MGAAQLGGKKGLDGNGLRQSKTVNGITTNHIWDGANIVADKTGTSKTIYTRGIGLISRTENGVKEYYHFNIHGDTAGLSNSDGTITKNYSYDAFGNQLTDNSNDTNPFRYCGEYYDAETGNIYLRARYYDPSVGRFISEDPIRDGLNWYVYCANNPVNFVDPLGLAITTEDWTAYYNNEISDFYWNLLNEADAMWRNAMEDDYTTKATARRMAVEARRTYNSSYVDDFDYTFGTGYSYDNDLSMDYGRYAVSFAASELGGAIAGLVDVKFERFEKNGFYFITLNQVSGRVITADDGFFCESIDVMYGISGGMPNGGIVYETGVFTTSKDSFSVDVNFPSSLDGRGDSVTTAGGTAIFRFVRGTSSTGYALSVSNNIYSPSVRLNKYKRG